MTSLRQRMIEDMQVRNLALHTQTTYVHQVSLFARHFNKSPDLLGPEEIRAYQVYLTNEKKLAPSSILIAVRHCAFSTTSPSKGAGPSRTSSQRLRNLRRCPLCSARKKSCSFSIASAVPSIAPF